MLIVEFLGGWSCWEGAVLVRTLEGGLPRELVRVRRVTGGEIKALGRDWEVRVCSPLGGEGLEGGMGGEEVTLGVGVVLVHTVLEGGVEGPCPLPVDQLLVPVRFTLLLLLVALAAAVVELLVPPHGAGLASAGWC